MRHCVSVVAIAAVALVLLTVVPSTDAYTVRYSHVTSPQPMLAQEGNSYCKTSDIFAHGMMPTTEAAQTAGYESLQNAQISLSPIAGQSRTASCLMDCAWTFMDGLFYADPYAFYDGIVYEAVNGSRIVGSQHTDRYANGTARDGLVYCGFDSCKNPSTGVYPQYWSNQSYYGQRKVIMTSTGAWQNVDYATLFSDYICEFYDYEAKDVARFNLATYPDGSVIPRVSFSQLKYCGKSLTRSFNEDGTSYWIYARCNKPFPWWAALVIAVVAFIIVAAIIIAIFCCCCHCEKRKEEKASDERNRTTEDNPANVPTQTQMNMSRASTLNGGNYDPDYDQEDEDERENN